jgi:pimeloyl-ACP methyl ester carboxylesterase
MSQRISLPTGVTLDVVDQGRTDGTPVVLLHGFLDSWHTFAPILALLSPSIRAIAPSFRGHGESSKPATGYAITDLAGDVAALHDKLGLAPAVVVGHSLGSAVALRFAIDQPNRTRALVLFGAAPGLSPTPAARAFWGDLASRLTDPVDPELIRSMTESMVARAVPDALLEDAAAESAKVPASVWRAFIESRWAGEGEYADELERVGPPTLVLWGDRDPRYARADQERLVTAIPQARLVVYEGVGHALHWEEPERFASDLVGFIDGLAAGSGSEGVPQDRG